MKVSECSKVVEHKSTSSIEIDKKGKETSSKEIVCCDPPPKKGPRELVVEME